MVWEEAGGGGGGPGYRIKNKNPTQSCGEKQSLTKRDHFFQGILNKPQNLAMFNDFWIKSIYVKLKSLRFAAEDIPV